MPVSTRSGRKLSDSDASPSKSQSPTPSKAELDTALMPPPPTPIPRTKPSASKPPQSPRGHAQRGAGTPTETPSPTATPIRPQTIRNRPRAAAEHQYEHNGRVELKMVHYIDLQLNPHAYGIGIAFEEPRFHCGRGLLFDGEGDENPTYDFGGPVMRIVADVDMGSNMPRALEDVMVCNRSYCEMCFPTEWEEAMEGESLTYALPFIHAGDCKVGDDEVLAFGPDSEQDYEDEADCGLEQRRVRYLYEGRTEVVESSVCIAGSCARCSPDTIESLPSAIPETSLGRKSGPPDKSQPSEKPQDASAAGTRHASKKDTSTKQTTTKSSKGGARRADKAKGKSKSKIVVLKLPKLSGPKPSSGKTEAKDNNTTNLPMVHFTDLSHRNDVPNSRYQALQSHKFIDNSPAYLRGGQVYTVYFYASGDRPARFEDVIICWDRACEVCSLDVQDANAKPAGGLPFVHLTADTYQKANGPEDVYFFELADWERGLEWDTSDIPRAGRKVVLCNSGGKAVNVRVEVCDLNKCRRCHPEDVDIRSDAVKAEIERKKTGCNQLQRAMYLSKGLPAHGHDHRPQHVKNSDKAKAEATSKAAAAAAAKHIESSPEPLPREPNALRMCHHHHLVFEDNLVRFEEGRHRLKVIDEYFVPEDSDIYAYGGPVFSVNFPNGTTRDVMACTLPICFACKKLRQTAPLGKSRWGGVGFVHRRDINTDEDRNVASFMPVGRPKYEIPGDEVVIEMDWVAFQGEDGKMRETKCSVCEEGSCEVCDGWEDAKELQKEIDQAEKMQM